MGAMMMVLFAAKPTLVFRYRSVQMRSPLMMNRIVPSKSARLNSRTKDAYLQIETAGVKHAVILFSTEHNLTLRG